MKRSESIPLLPLGAALLGAAALEWQSEARLQSTQSSRLRSLVQRAYRYVPHYHETWDVDNVAAVQDASNLYRLPILEPAVLRDLPAVRLLTEGIDAERCLPSRTSGSTGTPRTVYFSPADMHVIRGRYVWDLMMVGFRPWDRLVYLRFAPFRHHRFERLG